MTPRRGLAGPPPAGRLRVMVAQLNATVGDIDANVARARAALAQAQEWGADIVLLPELFVVGYPPQDLLLRPSYVAAGEAAVADLARATAAGGPTAVVGFAHSDGDLYNAAAVVQGGEVVGVYHKRFLPNYSVFDEGRYFRPGSGPVPVFVRDGIRIGVTICEDMWHPAGPARDAALAGAQVLLNVSASPFAEGKSAHRRRMMSTRADDNGAFVVFCNLVGAQDELVFDGHSLVLAPDGRLLARGASFEEDLFAVDLHPAAAT
ncbi:MAG: nitrilase-related carbon-nitrogen hydrolase, partial [Anaerolineae bacterium]